MVGVVSHEKGPDLRLGDVNTSNVVDDDATQALIALKVGFLVVVARVRANRKLRDAVFLFKYFFSQDRVTLWRTTWIFRATTSSCHRSVEIDICREKTHRRLLATVSYGVNEFLPLHRDPDEFRRMSVN